MNDSDNLAPEDTTNMNNYVGSERDPKDWHHLQAIIEDYRTSTIKRDILYWSDKKKRFHFIRAPQKNNKIPLSIIWQ